MSALDLARAPAHERTEAFRQSLSGRPLGTRQAYRTAAERFEGYLERHGEALGPGMGRGALAGLADELREHGLRRSSVSVQIAGVRFYLGWLESQGIDVTPQSKPRLGAERPNVRVTLDSAELAAFIRVAAKERATLAMALLMLAYTGMRVSEVLSLRCTDVVRRGSACGYFHVRDGKRGDRLVPIDPRLDRWLEQYMRGSSTRRPSAWLFPGSRGVTFPQRLVRAAVARCGERVGVPGLTPHGLRHAWVTHALRSGVPEMVVARCVGHANLNTTARYSRLNEADAANALAATLWSKRHGQASNQSV